MIFSENRETPNEQVNNSGDQTLELEESLFLCMYRVACIDKRLPSRAGSTEVQYTDVLHFFDPLLFPLFFPELNVDDCVIAVKEGGHVGPNLGFTEATVAMHYVFDAPRDKFVFDVSHQVYPHKMLTGRKDGFLKVDDMNAISGYSSPRENSEYDLFEVGHTSTSVALASGLQAARDLLGEKYNIVVVLGDGSLSGGEAFEGLNVAAEAGTNFIVLFNDNGMSIAENHGGMYKSLAALRESNGESSNNIFRALGFDYMYVEAGNNIEKLVDAFRKVKDIDHPIVVHLHTEKGHGYQPAVKDKEAWHWSVPFDLKTGKRGSKKPDGSGFAKIDADAKKLSE